MKLALLLTPFRLSLAVAVAIWATVVAIVAWCQPTMIPAMLAAPAWALVVLMVVAVGMSTIAIWAGLCFGGDQ